MPISDEGNKQPKVTLTPLPDPMTKTLDDFAQQMASLWVESGPPATTTTMLLVFPRGLPGYGMTTVSMPDLKMTEIAWEQLTKKSAYHRRLQAARVGGCKRCAICS